MNIPGKKRIRHLLALAFAAVAATLAQAGEYDAIQQQIDAGHTTQALQGIGQAMEQRPRDVQLRFLLAKAQAAAGLMDEAIATYSQISADFPELPEPYNNLAALYAARGELLLARQALEQAVQANPRYAMAYENLGDVYVQLARDAYEKAMQMDAARAASIESRLQALQAVGQGHGAHTGSGQKAAAPAARGEEKAPSLQTGELPDDGL